MMLASVSKLNIYSGDTIFDRIYEEFRAAQEEGVLSIELDISNLENEIRLDFMTALVDLGYDVGYSSEEEVLEVWYE
jgi:hypothetical protein